MAEIAVFPMARRAKRIKSVVSAADGRNWAGRLRYWRTIRRNLERKLWKSGVPDPEIRRQVEEFRRALILERELRAIDELLMERAQRWHARASTLGEHGKRTGPETCTPVTT